MSDTTPNPNTGFRTLGFLDFVRTSRSGVLAEQIEAEFALVMQAVNATQNSGKITLTLEIKPEKRSSETAVIIDTIKSTIPKFSNMGTIVFPTPDGRVSFQHPAQGTIPGIRDANIEATDHADRRFPNVVFGT
jgi:hypothetical protein